MDILPQNFRILWFCGLWSENDKFSPIFFIHKLFVLFLISHVSLGQVLYVLITSKNIKELTNGLVFTVTFVTLCIKLINFLCNAKNMKQLLNIFRDNICQPIFWEEEKILNNYRIKNLQLFFALMIISQSVSLTYISQPIFKSREIIQLPLQIYDPFHTTDVMILKFFYAMQIFECTYSVCLHMCFDTMIFGFVNLICALFDILCFRLEMMSRKENLSELSFKHCFKLHIVILKILKYMNSVFMGAISIMFVLILFVICSGIFQITEVRHYFYYYTFLILKN